MVARYGNMESNWLATCTPVACKWNWSMVTPPNRYAPSSTRAGRQVAKVVSANAIQPRPATMPSTHSGVYSSEMNAPASPHSAPPNTTAPRRIQRTG